MLRHVFADAYLISFKKRKQPSYGFCFWVLGKLVGNRLILLALGILQINYLVFRSLLFLPIISALTATLKATPLCNMIKRTAQLMAVSFYSKVNGFLSKFFAKLIRTCVIGFPIAIKIQLYPAVKYNIVDRINTASVIISYCFFFALVPTSVKAIHAKWTTAFIN